MFQPISLPAARVVERLSRQQRVTEIGRRAGDKARARGADAMDVAVAQISASVGKAAEINSFKLRVEQAIKLGSDSPSVRARYGARTRMLNDLLRGGAAVARLAHNQEVAGANPAPASSFAQLRSLAENGVVATPRELPAIDTAIAIVDRWYREERKAFQLAAAFGHGNRLSLEVLKELRLIARLIRRYAAGSFAYELNAVLGADADFSAAAE